MKKPVVYLLALALCLGLLGCSPSAESPESPVNQYGSESIASIESRTRSGEYTENSLVTCTAAVNRDSNSESKKLPDVDDMVDSIFGVIDETGHCVVTVALVDIEKSRALTTGDVITLRGSPVISESSTKPDGLFVLEGCRIIEMPPDWTPAPSDAGSGTPSSALWTDTNSDSNVVMQRKPSVKHLQTKGKCIIFAL